MLMNQALNGFFFFFLSFDFIYYLTITLFYLFHTIFDSFPFPFFFSSADAMLYVGHGEEVHFKLWGRESNYLHFCFMDKWRGETEPNSIPIDKINVNILFTLFNSFINHFDI